MPNLKIYVDDNHAEIEMQGHTSEVLTLLILGTVSVLKELSNSVDPEEAMDFISQEVKEILKEERGKENGKISKE